MWSFYTTEYYSVIQKKELPDNMLQHGSIVKALHLMKEARRTQMASYCMSLFIRHSGKGKIKGQKSVVDGAKIEEGASFNNKGTQGAFEDDKNIPS